MKIKIFCAICFVIALQSCSPKIRTNVSKTYQPIDYKEDIRVFDLKDSVPACAEELGSVKIGDSGFTIDCGWEVVVDKAKLEARKVGGNAIKITEHRLPTALGSTCHRITATILKVSDIASIPVAEIVDSSLIDADYALLHIYRTSAVGALINYDLHLGDSVLMRVSMKSKKTVKVEKFGYNTVWAKTESKTELPINIQKGHEYYIRCGISMGILVGRPSLELVGNSSGKYEFNAIARKKGDPKDQIELIDGRIIDCDIISEDESTVQFSVVKNGQQVKTFKNKSEIKSIKKGAL